MTTAEIIQEIMQGNQEEEVLKILIDILIGQKNDYMHSDSERRACLVAINKINNGKNEAIDALSDINNRQCGKHKSG